MRPRPQALIAKSLWALEGRLSLAKRLSKNVGGALAYQSPVLPQGRWEAASNVVFPSGIDQRLDLGLQERIDVYYGMAGERIGVARLAAPEGLPSGAPADPPRS